MGQPLLAADAASRSDHSKVTVSDASPLPPTHNAVSLPALHGERELELHYRLGRFGGLEFLDHDRADLTDRVQRLVEVEVPQSNAGHLIASAGVGDLNPDWNTAGKHGRNHARSGLAAVHIPTLIRRTRNAPQPSPLATGRKPRAGYDPADQCSSMSRKEKTSFWQACGKSQYTFRCGETEPFSKGLILASQFRRERPAQLDHACEPFPRSRLSPGLPCRPLRCYDQGFGPTVSSPAALNPMRDYPLRLTDVVYFILLSISPRSFVSVLTSSRCEYGPNLFS